MTRTSRIVVALPEPPARRGVPAAATCREAMRLLRRMLARLPWAALQYGDRERLSREVRRLSEDLALASQILGRGKRGKR